MPFILCLTVIPSQQNGFLSIPMPFASRRDNEATRYDMCRVTIWSFFRVVMLRFVGCRMVSLCRADEPPLPSLNLTDKHYSYARRLLILKGYMPAPDKARRAADFVGSEDVSDAYP